MARRKLIAANWKMNKTIAEAESFATSLKSRADGLAGCDLLLCPPFFALPATSQTLSGTTVAVGAQDLFWEQHGAFTGEVSGEMIRDAGGTHVIVGHSERRHLLGEADETVARKLHAAIASGLVVVFCVGERLEDREAGTARAYVKRQLDSALSGLTIDALAKIVIAYEPVWAIGTGKTASPADAVEMHEHVRHEVASRFDKDVGATLRIVYGGSVNGDNAASLLECEDIDGALVGGASLNVDSYVKIAAAVGS